MAERILPRIPNFWALLLFLGIFNIPAFFVGTFFVGGDSLSGSIKNGHYYVSDKGRLTEVSQGVWTYSLIHSITAILTLPSLFILQKYLDKKYLDPPVDSGPP